MKYIYYYETKLGKIGIGEKNGKITNLFFLEEKFSEKVEQKETDCIKEAANQLEEYLCGHRKKFNLPLEPQGTEFQKKDWIALQEIPYGQIASYGQIAKRIDCPKGARAVGLANNRNPISIFIPCHRVIGADGKLVGYGGGLDIKIKLLELEGFTIDREHLKVMKK